MDHGIWVMMPVKVVSRFCRDCCDLEVENKQTRRYSEENLMGFDNVLECTHLAACLKMKKNKED